MKVLLIVALSCCLASCRKHVGVIPIGDGANGMTASGIVAGSESIQITGTWPNQVVSVKK